MKRPRVVIVGGGFGGLYAAKALKNAPVDLTLIDRRNFHLFQPLLYQVATGGISPGDISSPLRAILHKQKNTRVIQAEVVGIDPGMKQIELHDGTIPYDQVIVATGVHYHYFGNEQWRTHAPGLKTIEDALGMRQRIFLAFESAEREPDPALRRAWLTFLVVGAGPTGVELAGALGELAHRTLRDDFAAIDTRETQIILVEGLERVLPGYPPALSKKAAAALEDLNVTIRTGTFVTELSADQATLRAGDDDPYVVAAKTILWAAGVKASPLGQILAEQAEAELDDIGRVKVTSRLTLPDHPDIFVVGDLAYLEQNGEPLPGVAQVAMQQGDYVAHLIEKRIRGENVPPFRYRDKGTMAVIGRNRAVADVFGLHLSGFPAWFLWVFIHIAYLIEFDNRLLVIVQWAADYFTRKRGARLITGKDALPIVSSGKTAK